MANFATLFCFPVIFAIFGAYTPDLRNAYGNQIFCVWIIFAIVFLMFAWRVNPTERSALYLILENEKLEDEIDLLNNNIDQLRRAIDLLTIQSIYSMSVRAVILEHSRRGINSVMELSDVISELASPLYLTGEEIFDFGSSEAWSFSVYLYSEQRSELIPVWREKARNHPSDGLGRRWKRGEGHVGKAFVDQRSIITGDAQKGEARDFSAAPPGMSREYDEKFYVSFASIPIGPILVQDTRPYGVIVGTSNRSERFDREKAGILVHVAGAIAAILIAGSLDIDNLDPPTQNAP